MQRIYLIALLVVGSVVADIDVESNINNIEKPGLIHQIPDIHGYSSASGENFFKEKCHNMTNNDKAYEKLLAEKNRCQTHFTTFVNVTQLNQEIEAAKPKGELDEVFGKYCKKTPTLIGCLDSSLIALEPCLNTTEKESVQIVLNATKSLVSFLCFKDGDRMAMFIAEGGIECVKSKKDSVIKCVEDSGEIFKKFQITSVSDQCKALGKIRQCVVRELEKCSEPTPANLTDALFKYMEKVAACKNAAA